MPTDTPQYQARNQLLRELYSLHCTHSDDLYEAMQNFDEEHCTDVPHTTRQQDPLRDIFRPYAEVKGWRIQTYHSEYWLQYNFTPPEDDGRHEDPYIKAYISFAGKALRQPFQELTLYLLQRVQEDFVIKVARQVRDDAICCWVRPQDVPLLKDYALEHASELLQPLPFVPYWHGIGLSRELPNSYNRLLSELFFGYFSQVPDAESVSLAEMLDRYVRDWNLGKHLSVHWHEARDMLLVLDSFSILLDDLKPENSILMQYEERAWDLLARAYCWDDLKWYSSKS